MSWELVEKRMKQGLKWLQGETWSKITREERYFCAELFAVIQDDVCKFVDFLNRKGQWIRTGMSPIPRAFHWEPAYEACFYRDVAKQRGRARGRRPRRCAPSRADQKRTFDLALFSNEAIVLIEAKAQQGFLQEQLNSLDEDRDNIAKWTGIEKRKVHVVGLISSEYQPKRTTRKHFDLMTTWRDLACCYSDNVRAREIFCRADKLYRK